MNAATDTRRGLAVLALAAAALLGCGSAERAPAAANSGASGPAGGSPTAGGGGSGSGTPNGGTSGNGATPGSSGTPSQGGTMSGSAGTGGPTRVCVNEPVEPVNCGATCTAVRANGPPDNRVSLVLLGEGFTEPEIGSVYAPHAEELAKYMFDNANDSEPYVRYKRFINFYRIDLVSNESGIDDPESGHYVDTPLDGETGCSDLAGQMCTVRWSKALDAFDNAFAGSQVGHIDWRLITLNYEGGCGVTHYPSRGSLAIYCPYQAESPDIALHEGGHGFHLLGDTYWTIDGTYSGPEPSNVNLSKDSTGQKWQHWLDYDDPTLGVIGAFEGGGQYTQGLYRPSLNQKMGSAERCHEPGPPYCPHDAVSREKIILDIYGLVRPLDAWSKNDALLVDPDTLTVDVVDCDVVEVDWWVDGQLLLADHGEQLVLRDHGLAPGRHTIEARAHDDTEWVRLERSALEQVVTWQVEVP